MRSRERLRRSCAPSSFEGLSTVSELLDGVVVGVPEVIHITTTLMKGDGLDIGEERCTGKLS